MIAEEDMEMTSNGWIACGHNQYFDAASLGFNIGERDSVWDWEGSWGRGLIDQCLFGLKENLCSTAALQAGLARSVISLIDWWTCSRLNFWHRVITSLGFSPYNPVSAERMLEGVVRGMKNVSLACPRLMRFTSIFIINFLSVWPRPIRRPDSRLCMCVYNRIMQAVIYYQHYLSIVIKGGLSIIG